MQRQIIYPVLAEDALDSALKDGLIMIVAFIAVASLYSLCAYHSTDNRESYNVTFIGYASIALTLLAAGKKTATHLKRFGLWSNPDFSTVDLLAIQDKYEALSDKDKQSFVDMGLAKNDRNKSLYFTCPISHELIADPVELLVLHGSFEKYEIHDRQTIINYLRAQQESHHYVLADSKGNHIIAPLPTPTHDSETITVKIFDRQARCEKEGLITSEWMQKLAVTTQGNEFSLLYSPERLVVLDSKILQSSALKRRHTDYIKQLKQQLTIVREQNQYALKIITIV